MRATAIFLILTMLALAPLGCSKSAAPSKGTFDAAGNKRAGADGVPVMPEARGDKTAAPAPPPTGEREKAEPLAKTTGAPDGGKVPTAPPPPLAKKDDMPPPGVADPVVGREKPIVPKKNELQSGILTAGSFDDNLDPFVFGRFVKRMQQKSGLGSFVMTMQTQRLLINVKDEAGKPVGDARVMLSAEGGASAELLTRSDGRAVFLMALDQLPIEKALTVTVKGPNGGAAVTDTVAAGSVRWDVKLPGSQARLPKNLDLSIVLDTTGSMGDEIKHLQAEIRGISAAIARQFPEVKQRFSLILYRDEGDEYVVRTFDFTDSLDVFHQRLLGQSAGGGGDYPEAVHRGLEEANQIRWRSESDTARVMFLVGDAPPHAQHMNRTLAAANTLRKRGIAIYPIACSGYDDATEFVMRSLAIITGSQFLFLTDDSGVGGGHAEPTIPYYQVERLEKLMIRTIASELSGRTIAAQPADIIRTVGKKVN